MTQLIVVIFLMVLAGSALLVWAVRPVRGQHEKNEFFASDWDNDSPKRYDVDW